MNATASELYRQGRLTEAIDAAIGLVKKSPTDVNARFLLAELSCIGGELERADRQLDTVQTQETSLAVRVALYRQLIRAETIRRECFEQSRAPEFLGDPNASIKQHLKAMIAINDGDVAGAADLIAAVADGEAGDSDWTVNDRPAKRIRDEDDLLAPVLEVFTPNGKYFWVSWDQILTLETHPPARPFDLLWRRATLSIEDGPDGEVFVPAIYLPVAGAEYDDADRLGHRTGFVDGGAGICRGLGQKTLSVDGEELPIMELHKIEREDAS